ncbi:MAG: sodium-dependent transporter [Coriobacteriales bacterium]|nr:sodium-dependent transporter [Coriobacteriales bacterium]
MTDIDTQTHEENHARNAWSGKIAFILAGAASAVGLGNLWRFPSLAAKYGGGTFLFTYVILAFTFGISLLLLETALGRLTRQSVIGAYSTFRPRWKWVGLLHAAVPFIITPYYCIIGGWVAKYLVSYVSQDAQAVAGDGFFGSFITSPVSTYVYMLIFMLLCIGVVILGVKNGIEKANRVMMPLLLLMAVGIAIFVLTRPGAAEGAAYYLIPDFSKFSPDLVINALGQMFYSLSLSMGIMVTYGSYLSKKDNLSQSVVSIAGFDLVVSFLSGLMIVPAAFMALGLAEGGVLASGPSLMFVTLPGVFKDMGNVASFIGIVFFLLVLFAALTSAISLIEACTSIVHDGTKLSRNKSLAIVSVFIIAAGCFINAGYNGLSFIEPLGEGSSLLDFFDFISNSVMMPIVALLTCIFVGWIIKPDVIENEVKESASFKWAPLWRVMIKYVAPVLVVVILVANVLPMILPS